MAKVTVKEIKDDAIVSVEMNKSFYFMLKSALFYLFKTSPEPEEKEREKVLAGLMKKEYKDMTHWEQSFYTLTLLLAEIEKQATENNLFTEVEVDLPGDPSQD
jgi:trehalose/maltose hydrolase-like predicted phosphorylase